MMNSTTLSINVRRLREANGLTQAQVSERAGISRIAYRNIESGETLPKANTLQSIAGVFEVKLQDLLTPVKELTHVRFRAAKQLRSRAQILTEVSLWLEDFNYLEEQLQDRQMYHFEKLAERLTTEVPGAERAKHAAIAARKELNLSIKEPIRDIAGLLEANGIKVYPIWLSTDNFFGLSVSKVDGGPAIAVNVWERISVERWIFSAAHELGHLLLHLHAFDVHELEEDDHQEKEANIFAAHFLMPAEVFHQEWEETYGLSFVDRVLKVKRIFQVSYKTVLYRLSEKHGSKVWFKFKEEYKARTGKTLRISDEPDSLDSNSFQQSYAEELRSKEPESLSSTDFMEDRLSRLVRLAIEKDIITLSRGSEILKLNLEEMRIRAHSWEYEDVL